MVGARVMEASRKEQSEYLRKLLLSLVSCQEIAP